MATHMTDTINVADVDLDALLKQAAPFRPYAEYDQDMDCIRVYVRDCAVIERRLNEFATLYYEAFPRSAKSRCAGLSFKGVNALVRGLGFPHRTVYTIEMLADEVVKKIPIDQRETFNEATREAGLRSVDLGVAIPDQELAAA